MSNDRKKKALQEVQSTLEQAAPKRGFNLKNAQRYMNSELSFLGLTAPVQRTIHKQGFSFCNLPAHEVLEIWDYIWNNSNIFEVMSQPLYYYGDKRNDKEIAKSWPVLSRWVERIENWGHSDSLSSIYVRFLEQNPKLIFPTLKKWNHSSKPWFRRQSIVSLLYYSSARKHVLPSHKLFSQVERLLDDEHYYVQKGVGWTLRELSQVYLQETLIFLDKHIARIHPAAFSAALEKIKVAEKVKLKNKRSRMRGKAKVK